MYRFLFFYFLWISATVFSQEELSPDQKHSKQAVLDFFEGFHEGDTSKIKKVIDKNMVMQTISKTKEGKTITVTTDIEKFIEAIHKRSKDQKWHEKLVDFKIHASADIAQIWTPYEFYVNEQFSHCGINIFQLFYDGHYWKIIAIADTRKKVGCLSQ